jgi:hypothetical protein
MNNGCVIHICSAQNSLAFHVLHTCSKPSPQHAPVLCQSLVRIHDVALLRNVQAVQELRGHVSLGVTNKDPCLRLTGLRITHLSNILVSYPTRLLDVGGTLRNILHAVAGQFNLILDTLRGFDMHAFSHGHPPHDLLTQEVPDLHLEVAILGLVEIHVDGEMGVHVAHLVLEAPRHSYNQVVDDGLHGAQRRNRFALAMVDLNGNLVFLEGLERD